MIHSNYINYFKIVFILLIKMIAVYIRFSKYVFENLVLKKR